MSVQVTGVNVVLDGLQDLIDRMPDVIKGALVREAEAIITDAKTNFVPVDTGVLRDSGMVGEPEINGNEVSIELGFGGAASAYALVQHERMDYHHAVGGPKYLERPFLEAANTFEDRLAHEWVDAFFNE